MVIGGVLLGVGIGAVLMILGLGTLVLRGGDVNGADVTPVVKVVTAGLIPEPSPVELGATPVGGLFVCWEVLEDE